MKKIIFASLFISSICFAKQNTMVIDNMSCSSCVKQVTDSVCKDKEMSAWFEKCSAGITDAEKMIGKIDYELKKGITLDADKKKKIENTLSATSRKVVEYK